MTDAGRNFYQRAVQILADLDDAEQSVTEETFELRGSLKLAAMSPVVEKVFRLTTVFDIQPSVEAALEAVTS